MKTLASHRIPALLLTVLLLSACGGGGGGRGDPELVDPTGWWTLTATAADMVGAGTERWLVQGESVGSSFWLDGQEFAIHGSTLGRVDRSGDQWNLTVVDADSLLGAITGTLAGEPFRIDIEGTRSSPPTGALDLDREGGGSPLALTSRTAYARVRADHGPDYELILVDSEPMLLTEVKIVHRDPLLGGFIPGVPYDIDRSGDVRLYIYQMDASRTIEDFATAGSLTFTTVDAGRVVGFVTAEMASGGTLDLTFDTPIP